MLLAGDEFGRTQQGNNNAYCQDNEISWVDWTLANTHASLLDFVRGLIAVRRQTPALRQPRFLHGDLLDGTPLKDVMWLAPDGGEISQDQWNDHTFRAFGMLLGGPPPTLLILNPTDVPIEWRLPAVDESTRWVIRVDSGAGVAGSSDPVHATDSTTIEARTVVLLTRESGANNPVRAPHTIRGRMPRKIRRGSERVRRA